jgi:radical SAM superfamily enzyme YgiQ (UPF0313 family)
MSQEVTPIINAAVVVPPIRDFYFTHHRFSALGAKIVYEILQKFIPSSLFFNFPLMRIKPLSTDLPDELSYLNEHIIEGEIGKLSFFKKYKHFGPHIADCSEKIISSKIDLCLISCFAYCYSHTAIELAEKIKQDNKNCTIIIGGAGVSACPAYFLKSQYIDYVVCGEAEVSLHLLMKFLMSRTIPLHVIPNIGWKEDGKQILSNVKRFTQSSEIAPLVTQTFENKESIFLSTTLSRGCSFTCQFCSNRISQGTTFRTSDRENIQKSLLATFDTLKSFDKGVILNFEDDNILFDYNYLVDIISNCKRLFGNIKFSFENGIDYRLLTPQRCKDLIDLGVCQFNFSIGTTDESISGTENRSQNLSNLDRLYHIIKENKIPAITYFICGFPDDTHETVIKNLHYLMNRPTLSGISLFYAVPGLGYYHNEIVKEHLFSPPLFAGSSAFPWNDSLSTTSLITAFRLSRFVNLIKSDEKTEGDQQLIKQILAKKKLYTTIKTDKSNSKIREVPNQDCTLVRKFVETIDQYSNKMYLQVSEKTDYS